MVNNKIHRCTRHLPGRTRVYIKGLRHNSQSAQIIADYLQSIPGVLQVRPCIVTGRVLIQYDHQQLDQYSLLQETTRLEQQLSADKREDKNIRVEHHKWMEKDEAAATAEFTETLPAVESVQEMNWHAVESGQVLEQFQVNHHHGLHANQVYMLRERFGVNQLQAKPPTPWIESFAEQFKEFTTVVLLGASVLSIFTGGWIDGLVMGGIVLLNAVIGAAQEQKAEQVVLSLNQFQPPICTVLRDGEEVQLSGIDLVPGDIVQFEAGDRVPADIRIIRSWNLEVNEAALTGESLPVAKHEEMLAIESPLSDRKNMLYMGTSITRGKAIGIVVATGMDTEIGYLMALMKESGREITPLQQKVTSISKVFFKAAMAAGGIVFATGILRGIPVMQMITTSITLAASAVPQGLPIVITIALSAGIFRMAEKQVLIRKLSALETLGRTTVICSDKTGTLTKNEMTVRTIATPGHAWIVTGNGYDPKGSILPEVEEVAIASTTATLDKEKETILDPLQHPELKRLLEIGLLCNNSKLEQNVDHWTIKGDPTEGALVSLAAKAGMWQDRMQPWSRCHEIPFDSSEGTMSVVCKDSAQEDQCFVFAKGSVEAILRYCDHYQENGEIYTLTEEKKQMILKQNEMYAKEALRVLGFAYRSVEWDDSKKEVDQSEMIFVGMVGMMDPPKPEVEIHIQEAYQLGVKPVMITGDHPITAIAIARQLGIGHGEQAVVTGQELDRLTDEELLQRVEQVSIFARVTPEHKLRIVSAYQKLGHYVAMTGDGVNDSPAIKKANVGIAMGRSGTEVTKETSDMILKEDHFGSIVDAVKEGRMIIGNIRRAVGCLLTGNLAEILVTGAAVLVGLPIPLVPIQILLMNLLTDAVPATILAINPGNSRKLTKRQDIVDRSLYQKVVTRGILLGVGSLGLFAYSLAMGTPLVVAQTVAFATLVAGQLMQTFSWRQEGSDGGVRDGLKDRFFVGGLAVSWAALLAVIYIPPLAAVFHTAPLTVGHWIPILLVASSISMLAKPLLGLLYKQNQQADPIQPTTSLAAA